VFGEDELMTDAAFAVLMLVIIGWASGFPSR